MDSFGHTDDRGVFAMTYTKGIIDIDVAELCQGLRELWIIALFSGLMEAP